jgi:hypothetical protein
MFTIPAANTLYAQPAMNPAFNGAFGAGWDNLPYVNEADNVALLGPRNAPLKTGAPTSIPGFTPNPAFNGGIGADWSNTPYLEDAANTALLGPRNAPLKVAAIVDPPGVIRNPNFNGAIGASWSNTPYLDMASNLKMLGPPPAAPGAPSPTALGALAAAPSPFSALSKTEWIAIAAVAALVLFHK